MILTVLDNLLKQLKSFGVFNDFFTLTSVLAQKLIEMILQSVQYLQLRALQLLDYPIISTTLCRSLLALCLNIPMILNIIVLLDFRA